MATAVRVQDMDITEPWCLAASDTEASAATPIRHGARRWGVQSSFPNSKNLRFPMGLALARL